MRIFILASVFFCVSAHASWTNLRCQRNGEAEFLLIVKDADARIHVETEQTRRYLLGLDCKIPNSDEPIFFCRGPGNNNLSFHSTRVHERGFPREAYGEFVDRERFTVDLAFNYINGKGESSRKERSWSFDKGDCVMGGAQ